MRLLRTLPLTLALAATPALAQDGQSPDAPSEVQKLASVTMAEATTLQPDDHVIGAEDAPASLVIYASVTCGHCGKWFTEQWPDVKADLVDTGRLRVAFREFPTAPAQVSIPGFMVANCGPEANYFDTVVHQMQTQEETFAALREGKGREVFLELGERSGLDGEDALQACFEDDDAYAPIDLSMRRAEAAGLRGVPAFFLDGERLGAAHDADDIAAALDGS